MKKFNAQAETHSKPVGHLRASRPRTEVFEQNDLATGTEHHAPHHLLTQNAQATGLEHHAPHHLLACIFFYLFLDYKHKHTATGLGCCRAHALNL